MSGRADKLSLTVTLPITDPLFTVKRVLLQQYSLSTQQQFQLARDGVRRPPRRACRPARPGWVGGAGASSMRWLGAAATFSRFSSVFDRRDTSLCLSCARDALMR